MKIFLNRINYTLNEEKLIGERERTIFFKVDPISKSIIIIRGSSLSSRLSSERKKILIKHKIQQKYNSK